MNFLRIACRVSTARKGFERVSEAHLSFFRSFMQPHQVVTDSQDLQQYNLDWIKKYKGSSCLALLPKSTSEVSKILSFCNQQNLAVVPQGGNTGLVGGSIPIYDQIVLSTRLLNKVLQFDKLSHVLKCQSGCILQNLNAYLDQMKFQVPLDLGAKGSCFIGGNIATNAGGKYFVKHGAFKSFILGLEVVRADGSVLNMLSGMKKDNTGFDLKQMFIGSEGTLGVITKAAIKCVPKSKSSCLVICRTDDYSKVLQAIEQSHSVIGKALGALQYMDGHTYQLVLKHVLNNQSKVVCAPHEHLLFIELCSDGDQPPVQLLFESGFDKHFSEIIASQNRAQYNYFWKIRQEAAVASTAQGYCYKYDVSLPIQLWKQLCDKIRSWDFGLTIGYGHAGDSNIHINIVTQKQHPRASHFEKLIFQEVVRVGGSISAEHGMGQQKPAFMRLQKSREEVQLMIGVKRLLDPRGILNPYKVLPE